LRLGVELQSDHRLNLSAPYVNLPHASLGSIGAELTQFADADAAERDFRNVDCWRTAAAPATLPCADAHPDKS